MRLPTRDQIRVWPGRTLALAPLLALALLAGGWAQTPAPAAAAAMVRGRVVNGTTRQPMAGIRVALFGQGDAEGSSPLAATTTRANGDFALRGDAGAMLARATYHGVNYWQPVTGHGPLQLTVYELAPSRAKFRLSALVAVVQPEHGQLAVVDEYVIDNPLRRTIYRPGGVFRLRLPRNIQPDGARVIGPSGVGSNRGVQPSSEAGVYTVDYPLAPGETRVQVSYRLPYATQQARLTEQAVYPTKHMLVYVPEPMKFHGAKFVPLTTTQGYQVYGALTTLQPLEFTVSGVAPLPAAMQDGGTASGATGAAASGATSADPGAGGGDDGQAAAAAVAATPRSAMAGIVPPKTWMEKNSYGVLIVLVILAVTCFAYLATRPRAAAVAADGAAPGASPAPPAPAPAPLVSRGDGGAIPAAGGSASPRLIPPSDSDLAKLKDELFLLEVRRQTGDIDESGYQQARAGLEARLRVLRLR